MKNTLLISILALLFAGCNIFNSSEETPRQIHYEIKQLARPGIVADSLAASLEITYQTSEGSKTVKAQRGFWESGDMGDLKRPQIVVVAGDSFYGSIQILDYGLDPTKDLIGNKGGNISADTPIFLEEGIFKIGVIDD